jgi:hypothetical protein
VKNLSKLAALISGIVLVFSVFLYCPPVAAQTVQQGTLLLSADTDCVVVFDGENLGALSSNSVKKIKADFGDHILTATFNGGSGVKKIITIKSTNQVIVKIAPDANIGARPALQKASPILKEDATNLTKEAATELYKAELLKQSPVDISKLKYYLSKGVDVHITDVHGWSLLHEAAFQGDTELINYCLKNGLPIDGKSIRNRVFFTPLSCAVEHSHSSAVIVLLRNKATYGIADGFAEFEYDSSNKYKGNFKDGKKDGLGTFYFANGTVYEGEWAKDKENGKGTMTWKTGDKYEGDWEDGWRTGQGTFTYGSYSRSNGDKYVGHFSKGRFSGNGTY